MPSTSYRTRGRIPSWSPPAGGTNGGRSAIVCYLRSMPHCPRPPAFGSWGQARANLLGVPQNAAVWDLGGRPQRFLGISLALDFVEQSRAAAAKAADRIGASSACCLTGLDRSCPGSSDQSMGSTLQPQNRNAFARGMLGPHMRSTINGPPSWDPVWGCESSDPIKESPSPPA